MAPPTPSSRNNTRKKKRRSSAVQNTAHPVFDAHTQPALPATTHLTSVMKAATTNAAEGKAPDHIPHTKMFSLPDEILLQIATHLGGHNALPQLSRANKRLHAIANEAMAKNLVVHPFHMKHAIEWLVRHPDLRTCVKSMDLVPRHIKCPTKCNNPGDIEFSEDGVRLLRETSPAISFIWDHLRTFALNRTGNQLWARDVQYSMDILAFLCPNFDKFDVQMPAASGYDHKPAFVRLFLNYQLPMVNIDCVPLSPIRGVSYEVLHTRLRSLTITHHTRWAGPVKHEILTSQIHVDFRSIGRDYITLAGFNKLQHLDIPMDMLGDPSTLCFQGSEGDPLPEILMPRRMQVRGDPRLHTIYQPAKVLPNSLVTLRLRLCNKYTFSFLATVSTISKYGLNLKQIDLFLDTSPRECILSCLEQSGEAPSPYFGLLQRLQNMDIKVTFYAGEHGRPVDMLLELGHMAVMNYAEQATVALKGQQYSDTNTNAIERREFSRAEHKLFMKHALSYFELFDSSTFDARNWTKVAFFHGTKNTKYDPELMPDKFDTTTKRRADVKPLPKRCKDDVFDLKHFTFFLHPKKNSPKAQPIPRELSLLGKAFALHPRVNNTVVSNETAEPQSDSKKADPKWPKRKNKSRKSGKIEQASDKGSKNASNPGPVACLCNWSVWFTGKAHKNGFDSDKFEAEIWGGQNWRVVLQPCLEAHDLTCRAS